MLAAQDDSFVSNLLVGLIVTLFTGLLAGIGCLVRILLDEDRAALWRGRFYKLAFLLTRKRDREKKYISNDVKGRLNLARRKMHFADSCLPNAVEVEWVEDGNPATYEVKEGEFVVRLDPSAAQHKNIVILAILLVRETTLRGVRSSVDKPLLNAIDMNLVRGLLYGLRSPTVFDWFMSTQYQPLTQSDLQVGQRNTQIRAIDESGLFTRLLLVELDEFCRRIFGQAPTPTMGREIGHFVDFLHSLATKPPGHNVPLAIRSAHISVGVILVAKTRTIIDQGVQPYVMAIKANVRRGVEIQYLLVFEKGWLGATSHREVARFNERVSDLRQCIATDTVLVEDFAVDFDSADPDGRRRQATLVRYRTPS